MNNVIQTVNIIVLTAILVVMTNNQFSVKTDKKIVLENAERFIAGQYNRNKEEFDGNVYQKERLLEKTTLVKIDEKHYEGYASFNDETHLNFEVITDGEDTLYTKLFISENK